MAVVRESKTRRVAAAIVAVVLATSVAVLPSTVPAAADPEVVVQGGITQVATWGHEPGTALDLVAPDGTTVASGETDEQGALLFRLVEPGAGYVVRAPGGDSEPVEVTDPEDHPDPSFYEGIELSTGYGYIPTRDGTLLSATVTMPITGGTAPYPTVVTYSGYDPSNPDAVLPEALPYLLLGYAVVAVNMRGSGCSGGAFDYYEPATSTDGYDVIETVAAQDWSNGRVGMVGISYSGISQLYVAATQPPHLEAITPLSPYADAYRGILYPGGIRNEGFALEWALDRQAAARPAARRWVRDLIAEGDTVCEENQVLRLQSRDLEAEITAGRFDPEEELHLAISSFAERVEAPTYLTAQFQDEQTGGSAANLSHLLQADGKPFRATFGNGAHADPLSPTEYPRVIEFIEMYVGRKVPDLTLLRAVAPDLMRDIFEDPIEMPPDRFTGMTFEDALAAYEAEPPVRVRYEVGGVEGREGAPYASATREYDSWPVPGTEVERWYLGPDGTLATTPPDIADATPRATSSYRYAPDETHPPTFEDGSTDDLWKRHPDVSWQSPVEDAHLTFTTEEATETSVYAGTGSVDLWLRSSAADTDVEAVLTEVRPDGHEVFVQSGWLRASHRALDEERSTPLRPWPTHREGDAAPLPADELTSVRMELFPFAHVIRPGSRLRLTLQAPGGNQPLWAFSTLPGEATDEVGHSIGHPSSVALPLLPEDPDLLDALPTAAPSCEVPGVDVQSQSLRLQPCRDDRAPRRPTGVTAVAGPGDGSVEVTWTAPRPWADGATPTGYDVVLLPSGRAVSVSGDATSATIDDVPRSSAQVAVVTPSFADGGGIASSPSTEITLEVTDPHEAFVRALWTDWTGAEPDDDTLTATVADLDSGIRSRRGVTAAVVASGDWAGHLVDGLYHDTLGRPADPAGRTYWVDRLLSGMPLSRVTASFRASPEYQARSGGTLDSWVAALYRATVGRPGSPAERAWWVERAEQHGPGWVALRIYRSPEGAAVRVGDTYRALLGRSPSTADIAHWGPRMLDDGEISVAVELTVSAEYLTRAQRRFP